MLNPERSERCATLLLTELKFELHKEKEKETDAQGRRKRGEKLETTYPGPAPLFNVHSREVTEKLKTENMTTCSCISIEKRKIRTHVSFLGPSEKKEPSFVGVERLDPLPPFVSVAVMSSRATNRSTAHLIRTIL